MAGNFVDSLLIGIGLDTSKVAEGAKNVGKQIADGVRDSVAKIPDQVTPALETAAGKAKSIFSSIWGQILGPLAGAFTVGSAVSNYISNSMSAGELADKLKVDIEEIQIWSGAMDRAGGSAASLQTTIEKLNASGKAQGDAIGVLLDLADKAGTMSKEAFVAKAKELEIDEQTIEVLAQGRKALDEHLKRQRDLGAYTKEDAEQSKKFKQSLADLLQAWDGFTSFIGRFTVPIMRVLADALTAVVVFMRQHTPFVVAAITMIGAALAVRLLPPLRTLPGLIANVGKAFLRWLPFVAVITAIALLVEDFWVYLQGGESELAEFWAIFGTGPEIMAKLNAAWKETKEYLAAIGTGLAQMVRYWYDLMQASGMFAALGQTFKGLLQILKGIFTLDWRLLGEGLSNVLNGLVKSVAATFKGLGMMVSDLAQAIFNSAKAFVTQWISSLFGDGEAPDFGAIAEKIWNSITETFGKIKDWVLGWFKGLFDGVELPSIGDILGGAGDLAKGAAGAVGGLLSDGLDLAKAGASKAGDLIGGLLGSASEGAAKVGEKLGPMLKDGLDIAKGALDKAGDFFGGLFSDAQAATADAGAKIEDGMGQAAGAVKDGFNAAWSATRDFAVTQFQSAATTIQGIFAGIVSGIEAQVGALVAGAQAMLPQPGMVPASAGVRPQQAGGGRSVQINQTNRTTIHAPGGDPAQVRQAAESGQGRSNRALVQAAQRGTVQK